MIADGNLSSLDGADVSTGKSVRHGEQDWSSAAQRQLTVPLGSVSCSHHSLVLIAQAGDAYILMTPHLRQAQDGHNLAWKIAAILWRPLSHQS
ncbi:hypothetical protein [Mycobacterium simiae]|uniref:Uncharacterized protein n=1 Tax=Mycobacterium simiae TaxID=1784 RepID=A0A1X0Y9S9_MYCSI|nr:hypothetical protein [Mycobacterium simiae]ORJ61928.1 hypothetical protein B5M45_09420 [Mycobacterium simiae]